ncbi:hypothetical protein [Marinicellulosiphila megalodicopiae]|uniref:hypothetical protein n=1 Tax=Marinicellulosiphila megalodicopiae TaxID=2724896 RepID=UPI003BB16095
MLKPILISILILATFQSCFENEKTTENQAEDKVGHIEDSATSSTILKTPVSQKDYTVEITDENYEEVYALSGWYLDRSLPPTAIRDNHLNTIHGHEGEFETSTETYQCLNDEVFTYTTYSNYSTTSFFKANTKDCEIDLGLITLNVSNSPTEHLATYEIKANDGFDYSYEIASNELGIQEMFFETDKIGNFFIRYDRTNEDFSTDIFYGSNNTQIEFIGSKLQLHDDQCSTFINHKTRVNGIEKDNSNIERVNYCLTEFNFEDTNTWQSDKNTLVYKIEITRDQTPIEISIVAQDIATNVEAKLLKDQDEAFFFNGFYGGFYNGTYYPSTKILDTGIYYLHVRHAHVKNTIPDVYIQIQAPESNIRFVEEKTMHTLSVINDQWIDSTGHDLTSVNHPTYRFTVTKSDKYYLSFSADTNRYFYFTDDKGYKLATPHLLPSDYYFQFYRDLNPGTYYITVMTENTGINLPFSLTLQSYTDSDTQLIKSELRPNIVEMDNPNGTLIGPEINTDNYTLEINESNYSEIADFFTALNNKLYFLIYDYEYTFINETTNDNNDRIITNSCDNGGELIITHSQTDHSNSNTDFLATSETCGINNSPIYISRTYKDGRYSEHYNYTQSDGNHLKVSIVSLDIYGEEMFIESEKLGNFFVRDNGSDGINYFGSNGSSLLTSNNHSHTISNEQCHNITTEDYILNGVSFKETLSEETGCD